MLKPNVFQQAHIATRNLPYIRMQDEMREAMDAGGVLGSGQIVWTRDNLAKHPRPHSAMAYVDGIGMVRVDPRWLAEKTRG